jgi:hypothetical protein
MADDLLPVTVDSKAIDTRPADDDDPEEVAWPAGESEIIDEHKKSDQFVLYPRSQRTLYKSIMVGERLWQRPPDNYCARCADLVSMADRMAELTRAFGTLSTQPDDEVALAVIAKAGGSAAAHTEIRDANNRLPGLRKHAMWKHSQRKYVKQRETSLQAHELMWYLDYGGFTDSAGRKVNCWGATVLAQGHAQEHFDIFFDAANQASRSGQPGYKKDGQAGIFCLAELLDAARDPTGSGRSVITQKFPNATHIILSGDTGNGFRGYEMLEALSKVTEKYGFTVELINLAPGHAYNRTDARIAHLNTFLRKLTRITRVFGAREIARALHAASMADSKHLLKRSNVFFRTIQGMAERTKKRKNLGAQIQSPQLVGGKVGVHGLLYFDFRLQPGYALTRQYGNPEAADNPTFVYTWRKDEAKKMCQACSDRAQQPVLKSVLACTTKKCNGNVALLVAPQDQATFPLERPGAAPVGDVADEANAPAAAGLGGGEDENEPQPLSPVQQPMDEAELDEYDANDTDALTDEDSSGDDDSIVERGAEAAAGTTTTDPPASAPGKKRKCQLQDSSSGNDDDTPPHEPAAVDLDHTKMTRADWISARLERPFGAQTAGLRETPHERAAREYDGLTSESSRTRRMGPRALSGCRGSLVDTMRASEQAARGKSNKTHTSKPKKTRRKRRKY